MNTTETLTRKGKWVPRAIERLTSYTCEISPSYKIFHLKWEEEPIQDIVPLDDSEADLAALYSEFAAEDIKLAEMGMAEYLDKLVEEETSV